jgi:hypothetical protein
MSPARAFRLLNTTSVTAPPVVPATPHAVPVRSKGRSRERSAAAGPPSAGFVGAPKNPRDDVRGDAKRTAKLLEWVRE